MRQLILSLSRQPNLPERGDFTCSLLILNSESHLFCVCSIEVNFQSMVIKIQVQDQILLTKHTVQFLVSLTGKKGNETECDSTNDYTGWMLPPPCIIYFEAQPKWQ